MCESKDFFRRVWVWESEQRSCPLLWWYRSGCFYISCHKAAGWAGFGWVGIVFKYALGLLQAPHLTDITLPVCLMWADVLGSFNHPLQSLPVLSPAHPKAVCNVSSQNAFYRSSLRTHELAWKFYQVKVVGTFLNYHEHTHKRLFWLNPTYYTHPTVRKSH